MAEFELEPGRLAAWADKIDGCSSELRRQRGRVEEIRLRLTSGRNYRGVERALAVIAENMGVRQSQLEQYGNTLEHIAKLYRNTEAEIAAVSKRKGQTSGRV